MLPRRCRLRKHAFGGREDMLLEKSPEAWHQTSCLLPVASPSPSIEACSRASFDLSDGQGGLVAGG